jgi:hypothetical protein
MGIDRSELDESLDFEGPGFDAFLLIGAGGAWGSVVDVGAGRSSVIWYQGALCSTNTWKRRHAA